MPPNTFSWQKLHKESPNTAAFVAQSNIALMVVGMQMVMGPFWEEMQKEKKDLGLPEKEPKDPEEWAAVADKLVSKCRDVLDRLLVNNPWKRPAIRAYLVGSFKATLQKPLPEAWVEKFEELSKADINDLLGIDIGELIGKYKDFLDEQMELPPEPPRGPHGVHTAGSRKKFGATMDEELYRQFQERRSKMRISNSAMLDTVVWHYLDRPKLSFEIAQDAQEGG